MNSMTGSDLARALGDIASAVKCKFWKSSVPTQSADAAPELTESEAVNGVAE
jgi:hypothetical protein